VVVESQELLEGQKRGIAVALRKAHAVYPCGKERRLGHESFKDAALDVAGRIGIVK
jgi:hypothetical protein